MLANPDGSYSFLDFFYCTTTKDNDELRHRSAQMIPCAFSGSETGLVRGAVLEHFGQGLSFHDGGAQMKWHRQGGTGCDAETSTGSVSTVVGLMSSDMAFFLFYSVYEKRMVMLFTFLMKNTSPRELVFEL